jgi:RNA polymerase sigma-70 factor (ECF subfamily)
MGKINNLSEEQDRELVELFKNGSQAAFEQLYLRYRNPLINLCGQILKSKTDAEDVVQDVFVQLWETRALINPEMSFAGYIKTLAQNRALYMYRQFDIHSRFARHVLLNSKDTTNETEDAILDNDYTALLDKVMESLSPKQKEVFRLSRIEGLKYKEIAELQQISVETVREHASIILKKIKKHLRQHADIYLQTVIIFIIFFS